MKPDQDYINRLEPGDKIQSTNGETTTIMERDKWGDIKAVTDGGYSRFFDKNGEGNPCSGSIKTP